MSYCIPTPFALRIAIDGQPWQQQIIADVSVEKVFQAVHQTLGFMRYQLRNKERDRKLADARSIAIVMVMRYNRDLTKTRVGKIFHRDHSTICYNEEKVNELIETNQSFKNKYEAVKSAIEEAAK